MTQGPESTAGMKGGATAERRGTMDGGVCARGDFGGGGGEEGEDRFLIGEPRARRSGTGSKPEGRFDVRGGLAQGTPGCTSECAPSRVVSPIADKQPFSC